MENQNKPKIFWIALVALFLILGISIIVFPFTGKSTQDKAYTIGVITPLSGNMAFIGQGIREGLELGAKGANSRGEKINLVFEDSQGDIKTAVTAYHKLQAQNNPDLIIITSSGDEALIELADKDNIPLLLTVSSAKGLPTKSKWVFRYFTNADVDAPVMAEFAVQNLGHNTFGVLYLLDNFGISYADVFTDEINKFGGEIIARESFQYIDQEYRTQLLKISSKNPEAIYLIGLDYQIIEALKEIKELDINAKIFSVGTIATKYAISQTQGNAEGVHMTAFCTDGTPQQFKTRFKEEYAKDADFFSENGYNVFRLIDEANERGDLTKEEVRKNFLGIKNFETTSGIISASPTGELVIPVCPKVVKNGKIFNIITNKFSDY